MGGVLPLCPQRTSKYVTKFSNHVDGVGWGRLSMFCPRRTSKYVTSFSNQVHGVDHTKSVAVSVRTLLTVALHQYVQRHVEDYSKSCIQQALLGWTVPISTGRRGEMTHRHSLQPLFLDLQDRKASFPQHEMILKKEHHGIATKKNKKRFKCAETSRLMHFEVIHKCQRR